MKDIQSKKGSQIELGFLPGICTVHSWIAGDYEQEVYYIHLKNLSLCMVSPKSTYHEMLNGTTQNEGSLTAAFTIIRIPKTNGL